MQCHSQNQIKHAYLHIYTILTKGISGLAWCPKVYIPGQVTSPGQISSQEAFTLPINTGLRFFGSGILAIQEFSFSINATALKSKVY